MIDIRLTEEDILQLKVIVMDQDKDEAYQFIKEKIMPKLQQKEGMRIISHLDGGKGSAL